MEAAIGFEPMHRGFADLSLTTWVRRLEQGTADGTKYHGASGPSN